MSRIFRHQENQPIVWFHRKPEKSNQYCLYCGSFVGKMAECDSNKEHLIGREFVPSGTLNEGTAFNFIFRACTRCNTEKSNIERHISTITLLNSPARRDSICCNALAQRKASKDYHPEKKGTLVKDSSDEHKINFKSGGNININLSFNLVSPPQPSEENLKILAFRHIQGIFSLITTTDALDPQKTCLLSGEYFFFFGAFHKNDWGNPQITEAIKRSKSFPCYANIDTAEGFFKVIMRRDNRKFGEWFWALEWNKSYRVFGGIYNQGKIPKAFCDLPSLKWHSHNENNNVLRFREEVPLQEDSDDLFQA